MIVMKFGGTSVGSPERIHQAYTIVSQFADRQPIVVVSAVGGVTDLLISAGKNALEKGVVDIAPIVEKHKRIITAFELPEDFVEKEHEELKNLLIGIKMIREISPKTSDYLVSFGERISCQLVAAYFRKQGVQARHHFAFDLGMVTDQHFQQAQPLPEAYHLLKENLTSLDHLPIVTGFIGKNEQGDITTLGRGGSDYTAAILGAAAGVEEIQIWTDVDGILTTDPRIVDAAQNVPVVSFKEAAELAYFGAKVLHPKTIRPAMDKGIPVVVKNTGNPTHAGTRIITSSPQTGYTAKAISVKKDISLVNIYSLRMLDAFGFLSRIFDIFANFQVVVDMVTTSEVSVSVTVEDRKRLKKVVKALSEFAQVKVEHEKSIICVVGEGLRSDGSVPGKIFKAISSEGITVDMISQGASDINLSFVIDQSSADVAVRCLHHLFFES